MPRPNLKETFLKEILKLSYKGTRIYYHGFGKKEDVLNEIKKDTKNKIGKIKIRKAGDIAPYEFRWLASFKVKN
jgi:tRNA G37 N-methylase Trm5